MKFLNKLKRGTVLVLALILASTSSLVVYAAVNYDSSTDPVVSFSGMISYVESVVSDIRVSIKALEARLALLEIGGTSQGGSSGGSVVNNAILQDMMDRIEALEDKVEDLESENASLKTDLANTKNEFRSLIDELASELTKLQSDISDLSASISTLKSDVTKAKNDLTTLNKNFKQISDISTKLETVTYKVNSLTSSSGDITVLKKQVKELQNDLDGVLGELGQLYDKVFVPYGATIKAKDEDDTVMLILRTGSAVAVSPYVELGKIQGLNDLTLGIDICNGESIPLYHNIMIPQGGSDGRGVTVTSLDGAYFLLGGDYTIVEP